MAQLRASGHGLYAEVLVKLGKLGWRVVTEKIEIEVPGGIERLIVKGPKQIRAI